LFKIISALLLNNKLFVALKKISYSMHFGITSLDFVTIVFSRIFPSLSCLRIKQFW